MKGSFECTCKDGYDEIGDQCNDIDECELGTHTCPENSECSNFSGESNFKTCRDEILVKEN